MTETVLHWLVTYVLHGAILIVPVWAMTRLRAISLPMKDVLWKVALVGPLLTATFQLAAGYQPPWGVALASAAPASAASTVLSAGPATNSIGVADVVLALWAAGAAFGLWRLAAAAWRLRSSLADRQDVLDDAALDGLVELRRRAGIQRRIRLTKTESVATPLALGRSEICLTPRVIERLPAAQVRSIIAHELAHLERRDSRWLWIGATIESVCFVQPLNFLARRELRANSELLADERARRLVGTGEPLARAPAEVAAWADGPQPVPLLAAGASAGMLKRRVERLLASPTGADAESYAPKMAACLGVLGAMALFAPGVVEAQPQVETTRPMVAAAPAVPETPEPPEPPANPFSVVITDDAFTFGMSFELDKQHGCCTGHVWAQPQWGAFFGGFDDFDDLDEMERELRSVERRLRSTKRSVERKARRAKERVRRLHRL